MKTILIALLFSSTVYAIDPQEGGAGTVCWTKKREWVATDELYNLDILPTPTAQEINTRIRYKDFGYDFISNKVNLNSSKVGFAAYDYILKLWNHDPKLANFLSDISYSLYDLDTSDMIIKESN